MRRRVPAEGQVWGSGLNWYRCGDVSHVAPGGEVFRWWTIVAEPRRVKRSERRVGQRALLGDRFVELYLMRSVAREKASSTP